ncbi:MAG: DNA topoisomerase IB [Candidatus Dormibacteria bacterium]
MSRARPAPLLDPPAAAAAAGLRYVSDGTPGISRVARSRGGFLYRTKEGTALRDAADIQRIAHLAIPPAWTEVWICPFADGHIQATGRDARRRKQYRYHERWREVRDRTKYERSVAFGHALPRIRARVAADLARPDLSRERVLATVVRLLDVTLIRVGNEEYARDNRSYGLTTMRTRHVDVDGSTLRFVFRGKSGKQHSVEVQDRRVARVMKALQDLPGQLLFQWVGDAGDLHTVESGDVNAYIREAAGDDFTAKDFRTWAGTVLAAWELRGFDPPTSRTEARRQVVAAITSVARQLGNTPAVCRRCYIHPAVLDAHGRGTLRQLRERVPGSGKNDDLSAREAAVLALLRSRADAAA